jgi:hypothetical protein
MEAQHPPRSIAIPTLALLLCAAACGADARDDDRAVDIATNAPDEGRSPCPVYTRGGACRPLRAKDVVTLATGGLVLPGAWFSLAGGGALAFGVRWGSERLVAVRSARALTFDSGESLSTESKNAATGVSFRETQSLYIVAGNGLQRVSLNAGQLEPGVPVTLDGTTLTPSWPQAAALPDGRVLLAFVEPQRKLFVGVDDGTGLRFRVRELQLKERDLTGVLAHVGTTNTGAWVLTYQVADSASHFRASALVSTDEGASWKEPVDLGDATADAFPIARNDHGADLYYTVGVGGVRSIRRRALHDDGSTGPEQFVTADEIWSAQKPQPRRLVDGRMAMLFTLDHGPRNGDLAFAVIDGDAPW